MPLYTEPNVANVFAGPTVTYLAPAGTAPPSLATQPTPATWASAGYQAIGYTENGVDLISTPSIKDITPDETITPILQIITGVKAEVKVTLFEASIENLAKAIGLTVLTNPGTGIKTLGLGSGNPLITWRLGFQGPSPGGAASRVIVCWRVQVISAITQSYQRKDISKLACSFSALTDSSQPVGSDVWLITDFGVGS
jgi:hypothetical protein